MSTLALIVGILLWALVGIWSLTYHWTREFDVHAADIAMFIYLGTLLGPIALIFAFIGFIESHENQIVIRRRNGKE